MEEKKIVLFDGVCTFCNFWVRFIFKRNKERDIFFMPLQDERAANFIGKELNINDLDSVVYYNQGKTTSSSTAALEIGKELNFLFKIMSNILLLIPKGIRDSIYNLIAKNRYKWFGKKENCPIPSPEMRKQFL